MRTSDSESELHYNFDMSKHCYKCIELFTEMVNLIFLELRLRKYRQQTEHNATLVLYTRRASLNLLYLKCHRNIKNGIFVVKSEKDNFLLYFFFIRPCGRVRQIHSSRNHHSTN